jgi:probable phosphoglycerate mutase
VTAQRVVCWRHGRTAHNHGGIWQGQLDIPLDEVGSAQASRAAEVISGSLSPGAPLAVVSSDLVRASATAEALAALAGLPVRLEPRLREIDAGRWQGLTRAQIAEAGMGTDLQAWLTGDDVRVGGGERRSEVAARGAAAVVEHAAALTGGTLVVVAHGGVLRGAILDLLGLPMQHWRAFGVLGNAHWAELVPGHSAWRLVAYNQAATPIGNRFEAAPRLGGRLAEPHR